MMDSDVQKAYDYLVPADQLVVDAMIVTLYQKDMRIRELAEDVLKHMEGDGA